MKYTIFFIAAAAVLTGCGTDPRRSEGTPRERADARIERLSEAKAYPGFTVAVTDGRETLYSASSGKTGGIAGEPIDTETAFYAYSTAKILTACSILQLAGQGALSLDDSLADYLEFVPWPVTIRQTLSHSSGIPNPIIGEFFIHFPPDHSEFDGDALIRSIIRKNSKLLFEPGSGIAYSNLGYALLGLVIEKVTGSPYPDYVREHIFKPLGIAEADAAFDPFALSGLAGSFITKSLVTRVMMSAAMSRVTFRPAGKWTAIDPEYYFNFPSHGGLIISADAFAAFLRAVLNRDERLMGEAAWSEWFTIQASSGNKTYAAGWSVSERAGTIVYEHSGGAMGESAHIAVYPEKGIATVYLTNLLDSRRLMKKDHPTLEGLFLEAFGGM